MNLVKFRLGEMFCGPGGMALGAISSEALGSKSIYSIKHEWSNDFDFDSCETYKKNIPCSSDGSVFCLDVKDLEIERLSKIDAFAYGFPCNDFSIVGEQKGFNGNYGPLYSYGLNVINFFKPKFFVAENVGGLISANDGIAFKRILSELETSGNGYNLTVHLYKSEEYGIPQTRHRIIIVGIDKSLNIKFRVPKPTHIKKYVTVREAIEEPIINNTIANQEITKQSSVVVERLKYIKPGENVWTANLPEHLKLKVKGAKLSQIYKRLHPDKPSYTITGSGGGGTHCYHWEENRALTNRERARLQTFPDDFVFIGSKESVRRQIGMAVPPKLSRIIFTNILNTFAGINYEYIYPKWNFVNGNGRLQESLFKQII